MSRGAQAPAARSRENIVESSTLREVAVQVCHYFRDFLESDFKRQQAPRRRVVLQTQEGFRAGMRVRPYPSLEAELWNLLSRPSGEALQLKLPPRKHTRALSPVLRKIIDEHLQAIDEAALEQVRKATCEQISRTYARSIQDPEQWVEQACDELRSQIAALIVRPLISHLDQPLRRQAYSVIDSLYAAETEMIAAVAAEAQLKPEADRLEEVTKVAGTLRGKLQTAGLAHRLQAAYRQLVQGAPDPHAAAGAKRAVEALARINGALELLVTAPAADWVLALQYVRLWLHVRGAFQKAPQFDYVGTKTKLERLNTSMMNAHVDGRLVSFMDNHRADAKVLSQLISQRQKFPEEKFDAVRSSFPIIIASIREFGEYMPLVPGLFDVVVIDEASQVSVAQALPAILRAKKVVVLGDSKQFSNVKSSNASIAINERYRANLVQFFERNVQRDAEALQRLAMFDVKRSILEFCSMAASYTIMLRKHFRSYPELISYSSGTFYNHQLQAIKVRGVPVDEVIRFDQVDIDGHAVSRTTNTAEATFIAERLVELLEQPEPPTVGVITPFREQHTLLTKMLFGHERAAEFERRLRLKVMTFDSCQGEERQIIFYSMVASPGRDALNYIFPVSLDGASAAESVEDKLKVQRLNVGFSRAQEMIWFVHSMPIGEFRGAIGAALQHYSGVLRQKHGNADQTDASSPMEQKVLGWLQATRFVQAQPDDVEIVPQFPIGEYLKQLDPTYEHPDWRVDFLVIYRTERGPIYIVVEYDGFEFHFQEGAQVHVGNHHRYLKPEDVERQLTLESYGYRFLRINRFNCGKDPVATLDERLAKLVEMATGEQSAQILERLQAQAEGMLNRDMRQCTRCSSIKPLEGFFDRALRGGQGGYGRVCADCKGAPKELAAAAGSYSPRRFRPRWR